MLDAPARPMAERAVDPLQPASSLETWRCRRCKRILAKIAPTPGVFLEIKCSSCNCFCEWPRDVDPRNT